MRVRTRWLALVAIAALVAFVTVAASSCRPTETSQQRQQAILDSARHAMCRPGDTTIKSAAVRAVICGPDTLTMAHHAE